MRKSRTAFEFSADRLAQQGLYMWTFTFKEVLSIRDTRKLWNHLLTLLKRKWPDLCGLRVFELHKSHGLHVHLITNRYIRVEPARKLAIKAGWGRVHVVRAKPDAAKYLAKYLSKAREPCFKGWRLWAGFGKWDWSRVKDILLESPERVIWHACAQAYHWKGNRGFQQKRALVNQIYRRTIEEGWDLGRGPGGRPYNECRRSDLVGSIKVSHSSVEHVGQKKESRHLRSAP